MINTNQPGPLITRYGNRIRQRGVVLPLVVIGLLAIIAMAGLAIDSSHAFVNKTRLQNMVDAAALSAAKEYDETDDTILGAVAANANFGRNTDGSGNFEIDSAYDNGDISVIVQWSETLNPFVSAGIGPYVRVIAAGFSIRTGLVAVIGINSINIRASAVAGPSPTIDKYACDIAPLVVCANEPTDLYEYGFAVDRLMVLKPDPGNHQDVGPGNYKLLRLECGAGGDCVRENMAGSYEECVSSYVPVETEPGVKAGVTSQGFNTRFGEYLGPMNGEEETYPADANTEVSEELLDTAEQDDPLNPLESVDYICYGKCDCGTEEVLVDGVLTTVDIKCKSVSTPPDNWVEWADDPNYLGIYNYDEYMADMPAPPYPNYTSPERRILALPVADCTGDETGQSTLDIIGFACYFMLQPIAGGNDKNIFGQFVEECAISGAAGMIPGAGIGPYIIQLYKDPDSIDS